MLLALKRLAHYNRIDSPTGPSFVHFPMAPEQRTTVHVKFSDRRQGEVRPRLLLPTRVNTVHPAASALAW